MGPSGRLAGHVIHDWQSLPGRIRDEVMQPVLVGSGHCLLHAFDVFGAGPGLHQAAQVDDGLRGRIAGEGAEESVKTGAEGHETICHVQKPGGRVIFKWLECLGAATIAST